MATPIAPSTKPSPIKLDDEQVRRYITDGVLVLNADLNDAIHQRIFEKISWNNNREFNMGNNVLPRVPELQQVIDAPSVRGALQSVLGDDYILHPHRFMHASEPLDEADGHARIAGHEHGPTMGKGSSGSSHWHQDAHSPLSRARYQVPRFAMILYFPQDTPASRGPTRVIPGTHLQATLEEADYPFALVPDAAKAGTCVLVDFDIAHAGMPNHTDMSRYMFKFVFMRTRNPLAPSWNGGDSAWQDPSIVLGRYRHTRTWSRIWEWMRGTPQQPGAPLSIDEISQNLGQLNVDNQALRLDAIERLADGGAVEAVADQLLAHAGKSREFSLRYKATDDGSKVPDGDPKERRWTEGATVLQDEAYALGAMGESAVDRLLELLDVDDAWIKINAAFALGEIGAAAGRAIPPLAAQLLHKRHQVARAALDAIAAIGVNTRGALPAIQRLLTEENPGWQKTIMRGWSGENQARFNAMCALLGSDIPTGEIEELLVACLDDPNGYVPALALEMLTAPGHDRVAPPLARALDFLKSHRFDDTLASGQRVY